VNDILDLAKMEGRQVVAERKDFELRETVVRVVDLFANAAREKNLKIVCNIDSSVPAQVSGDGRRVEQVLTNIMGNALKFTEQGEVQLSVKCYNQEDHHSCVFSIKDTGIGIPKDKLPILFERFKQADESIKRRFGGTGLGLAISKELVELMGGNIWVESEPGVGTEFKVSVSFTRAQETGRRGLNAESPIGIIEESLCTEEHPAHVLLVDDSADNRDVIRAYLGKTACQVEVAENGKVALDLFKRDHFDLILMDMQMPIMDGYTATKEIRFIEESKGVPHTPIIALSAYAMSDEVERSLKAGCDDHLSKPVRKRELLGAINHYLH
jgi:CheY-like chemotaxis protein